MSRDFDDLHDDQPRGGGFEDGQDEAPLGVPALLDALTDLVERSRSMPMSSSVLVNRTEALDLIDAIHEALPHQLTHADEVLSDADQTFVEARQQADAMLAEARDEAAALVSRDAVVRDAQVRAAQVVADAEQAADRLRSEADDYCDRRLAEFEIDLGRVIAQVQAGREKLAGRLGTH